MPTQYRIEVLLGRGTGHAIWMPAGEFPTPEKALYAAGGACQSYAYRMACPDGTLHSLEWIDDPTDDDLCICVWR